MTRIHVYHEQATTLRELVLRAAPHHEVIAWSHSDALRDGLVEVEVLFTAVPPREDWSGAGRLKLIQMMGVGVDGLLPAPSLPPEVQIAGMRGMFAAEASEHAIGMMLALLRGWPTLIERQRTRVWRQFASQRLAGETACVVGVGAIGTRIAKALGGLEMSVVGVAQRPRAMPHFHAVLGVDDWLEALGRARVLFVAVPLTRATIELIDARVLAALPRGALLIALSRGGIVDESALLQALRSGHLGGAALDVFATEPLPEDHALWDAPNMIVTPHLAGVGLGYVERAVAALVENVSRLERGLPPNALVDRALGY